MGVIKKMYKSSRSEVLLEGEHSAEFDVEQGNVVFYHQSCFQHSLMIF